MSFPTTQWTLINNAAKGEGSAGREALNELCGRYRDPVVSFFRTKTQSDSDAEELTQDLFLHIHEKEIWSRADAERGRFRSFLSSVAFNVYRHWSEARRADKRGGGKENYSIEQMAETGWELPAPDDPASLAYDREWAIKVVAAARKAVKVQSSRDPETAARFAVLRQFLPGSGSLPSYDKASEELGLRKDHLRTLVERLRVRFRDAVRAELAETLLNPDDVEDEFRHLVAVLGLANGRKA